MDAGNTAKSTVAVDGTTFAAAVDQVVRAAARDAKRPVMRCVLIEAGPTSIRLVATDALRLIVVDVEAVARSNASFTVLVPATSLAGIVGALDGGEIDVGVEGDSLIVTTAGRSHSVSLESGQFPPYERFLAADPAARTLVVDKAALVAAIEDLPDDEPLSMRFTRAGLVLGDIVPITVPAVYDGDDLSVVLNPLFVHDAVQPASGSELAIDASSPVAPVVFRSAGDERFTAVVMPMRTGGRSGSSAPR